MILVNSIHMYAIIDEYHQGILMEEAEVNTKYKTVDRKITCQLRFRYRKIAGKR